MAQTVNASACNAEDPGSIPGFGRAPREGNGNPLQYSCLENYMDGGASEAIVHGVAKSRTQLRRGFPGGLRVKNPPANAGGAGLIPEVGRSPGGGNDNPFQYFFWGNPLGQRSLVGYSPWGHKESSMTECARIIFFANTCFFCYKRSTCFFFFLQ